MICSIIHHVQLARKPLRFCEYVSDTMFWFCKTEADMWIKHMISASMPADEMEIGLCPQLCEICQMLVEQCP